MDKRYKVVVGVIVLVGIVMLFANFVGQRDVDGEDLVAPVAPPVEQAPATPSQPTVVNYATYNYDFVDENVKRILNSMLGPSGKTAFYLPPTGYINVSRGSKYGVAYALNNPNPSGENRFVFNWTVDDSIVESCGVSKEVGQGWIERGWTSWGMIGEGWIDHMTIYFSFPEDAPTCIVKYNFLIEKDGEFYDSKVIEIRIA